MAIDWAKETGVGLTDGGGAEVGRGQITREGK